MLKESFCAESAAGRSGDRDGLDALLEEPFWLYACRGLGDSSVGVSDSCSAGSLAKAPGGIALRGSAGSDFSVLMGGVSLSRVFAWLALDLFFLLAITDS